MQVTADSASSFFLMTSSVRVSDPFLLPRAVVAVQAVQVAALPLADHGLAGRAARRPAEGVAVRVPGPRDGRLHQGESPGDAGQPDSMVSFFLMAPPVRVCETDAPS